MFALTYPNIQDLKNKEKTFEATVTVNLNQTPDMHRIKG